MKVEKNTPAKDFQPVRLTITLESKRELELFWLIFNKSNDGMSNFLNTNREKRITPITSDECKILYPIWTNIDTELFYKNN